MKRTLSLGTAAAFGLGSALIALSPAAQAVEFGYNCSASDDRFVGPITFDITTDLPDSVDPGEEREVEVTATTTLTAEEVDEYLDSGVQSLGGGIETEIGYSLGQSGDALPVELTAESAELVAGEAFVWSATGTQSYTFPDEGQVVLAASDLTRTIEILGEGDGTVVAECTAPEGFNPIQTVEVNADDDAAVPTTTNVVVDPDRIEFGDDEVIIGALVTADEGDDIPAGEAILTFAGDQYTEVLNEDGIAAWEPEADIPAGVYDFTIDFVPADPEAFAPSSGGDTLVVFAGTATVLHLEVNGEAHHAGDDIEIVEGSDIVAVATPTAVPAEAGEPVGDVLFEIEGVLDNSSPTASPAEWDLTAENLEPGEYTLVATFQENEVWGESISNEIDFTVVAATTGAGYGSGALPATGADASWSLGATALLLVGVGTGAIVFGRRKAAFLSN